MATPPRRRELYGIVSILPRRRGRRRHIGSALTSIANHKSKIKRCRRHSCFPLPSINYQLAKRKGFRFFSRIHPTATTGYPPNEVSRVAVARGVRRRHSRSALLNPQPITIKSQIKPYVFSVRSVVNLNPQRATHNAQPIKS